MSRRLERVNALFREEISEILQFEIKDPRLSGFISVTEVNTAPDLSYAKVFVSGIYCVEDRAAIIEALTAAAGFIRRELAGRLSLRRIPKFNFEWDNSIEQGDRIAKILDNLSSP